MNKWCKHYRGMQHETCGAGCSIPELRTRVTLFDELPCIRPEFAHNCASHELPTREEEEAAEKQLLGYVVRIASAKQAILTAVKSGASSSGTIDCPTCGESLRYSVATNGHIRARCSSEGCCAWIE